MILWWSDDPVPSIPGSGGLESGISPPPLSVNATRFLLWLWCPGPLSMACTCRPLPFAALPEGKGVLMSFGFWVWRWRWSCVGIVVWCVLMMIHGRHDGLWCATSNNFLSSGIYKVLMTWREGRKGSTVLTRWVRLQKMSRGGGWCAGLRVRVF